MTKKLIILAVLALLLAAGLSVYRQLRQNPDCYTLDVQLMNGYPYAGAGCGRRAAGRL